MPELAQFLEPFRVQFAQGSSAGVLDRYVTGLLTEHPNKNCQTLAGVVPGTTDQDYYQGNVTQAVPEQQAWVDARTAEAEPEPEPEVAK